VPSWPTVIATTLRLWLQRHVLARTHSSSRTRRPRGIGLIAVLAIIVAGSAVAAFALTRTSNPGTASASPTRASATSSALASSAALMEAAASRQQAAAWVAAQVSRGVIVACDPLMCNALQQRGFPAADLLVITASSGDPLGSAIVVSTTAVRSQLGPRLATVYAPVVIASFGTGAGLVQVRAAAVGGAAAYHSAMQADLLARKVAGRQLDRNRDIRMPSAARADLAHGRVDARILITLAALAHRFPIKIVSFSDSGPGADPGVPLRVLTVIARGARYLSQLLAFLRAQRPPLRALVSEHSHGKTSLVHIQFTAPSLTGLLGAGVSA
jgi:hypothetical protein